VRPISFATPSSPIPAGPSPSFEIRGASSPAPGPLRWDRINSGEVLRRARQVYFHYFEHCPGGSEPLGIVLQSTTSHGRVVFDLPVLLPEEQFVPLEMIRGRGPRPRGPRSPQRW
jgi:hypothetical protein